MIQIIVFSFNRALQCAALLDSVENYWKNTCYKLTVIYNSTGRDFQRGYDILKQEYSQYEFVRETNQLRAYHLSDYLNFFNFKKLMRYKHLRRQKSNFRDLLNNILATSGCDYTMYLTDDSVFIRDVILKNEDLAYIDRNPQQNQISLRLGKNITEKPSDIVFQNGVIEWDFHSHRNARSWGYNFSVDAHIYSTKICYELQSKIIFNNPTTLEANIVHYVMTRHLLDHGLTYEYPFILSFPINMVQKIADNESLGVPVENLNKLFLDGKRLEYVIPKEIKEFQQYPDSVYIINEGKKTILRIR